MNKLVIITILLNCNIYSQECNNLKLSNFKIDELQSNLIGEWVYSYSYINDTCIKIDNFGKNSIVGELSKKYKFYKDTNQENIEIPINWTNNAINNFKCELLVGEDEYIEAYPFLVSIHSKNNSVKESKELVLYHSRSDNSMLGSFFIESLFKEVMILSDEFFYQLGNEKLPNFHHVYIKSNG